MQKRLASMFVISLLGAGLVLASDATAAPDSFDDCVGGVLATDEAGDGTYAGLTGTDLESDSGDIVKVSTTLAQDAEGSDVVFTTGVSELGPTDPHHFDLLVNLDLLTDTGDVIAMTARRSNVLGPSGTVDGSSEGVTAEFADGADEIRLTVPADVFDGVNTVSLRLAQTRYDTGARLSPLADEATGTCSIVLSSDYEPPTVEDVSKLDTSILVIDTGVNGKHPEFADRQIFAWWDFSKFGGDPDPGDRTWFDTDGDNRRRGDRDDPYDPNGHGSSVSSMAAGSNAVSPSKTPSACPGCSLAVAKVLDEDTGSLNGSIGNAIRWGVDVLDVDVITISIGAIAPVPAFLLEDTYAAAEHARANGVLVVFANGNGWGNAGIPGQPGGFMPYGNSTHVLSVGADDLDSFLVTTDPEVVAVFRVHAAGPEGSQYQDIAGTSFSAPFTAGVAARIIGESRACQKKGDRYDDSPDSIEELIEFTAEDRPHVPPTFEGYGQVTLETLGHALAVVCGVAGMPIPDEFNDFYVTNVSGTQRELATTSLDGLALYRTGVTEVTGQNEIGPSSPSGPKDAEIYTTTVAAGDTFTMTARGTGGLDEIYDFDMALYAGGGDIYEAGSKLASSGNVGAVEETLSWVNTTGDPVDVSAIVYGWAVGDRQPFAIGTNHSLFLDYDGYVLADHLLS